MYLPVNANIKIIADIHTNAYMFIRLKLISFVLLMAT